MKRLSPAVVTAGFAAYSYAATVLSVAWYLRRDDPALGLETSLIWAALTYAPWLGVGVLVWGAMRLWGPGWRAAGVLTGAMLVLVPAIAAFDTRLGLAFLQREPSAGEWLGRIVDRLPVALLLYTALIAAGLAAAHWRRAREAQKRVEILTEALDAARRIAPDEARLLVSTGRSRTSVETRTVEWFASAGNYVVVNWDGREGLVRDTLQGLEARLDDRLFARIHRSSLVNLARVAGVQPLSDGSWRLTMESGAELVVSRTYRDAVLERLGRA
ncbi:LytR/AlgR family response regulator transcription factor [Brevundimonas sp.]|jgi:DNA-binding LytR/AlgR family response regulator|uniref:LytR/AlgR family response regulator transcription factor n=1 Tax=Brevundimonas sp. TaxID=1871086 RepID=UPI0037C0B005